MPKINTSIFSWDKSLTAKGFEEVKNLGDDKKIVSAGPDYAYFGHQISKGEKWKHRFEIAGILLGTLLIIPIPILAMTGSYKRLARCNSELNKNIIVEGRINNLKDEVLKNKNTVIQGKLKDFEEYSDKEILDRIKKDLRLHLANGTIKIDIQDLIAGKIGELIYDFEFNLHDPNVLRKTLREVKIQPKFAQDYNSDDLERISLGRNILIKDENGLVQNNYIEALKAPNNFEQLMEENLSLRNYSTSAAQRKP